MNGLEDFNVGFGKFARTIIYSDKSGAMLFCFDITPAEAHKTKKWTVHLGHTALSEDGKTLLSASTPQSRIDLAFDRTKQYLVSCGYEVVRSPK